MATTRRGTFMIKRRTHKESWIAMPSRKNANMAINHNLALGYAIGYDKYRSLTPEI